MSICRVIGWGTYEGRQQPAGHLVLGGDVAASSRKANYILISWSEHWLGLEADIILCNNVTALQYILFMLVKDRTFQSIILY